MGEERRISAFLAVAAPWYVLCYLKNGAPFIRTLIWEHHVGRYLSAELQHPQPFWFFCPVFAAALFPWTPSIALLFSRRLYSDPRCKFLGSWLVFGLVFAIFGMGMMM